MFFPYRSPKTGHTLLLFFLVFSVNLYGCKTVSPKDESFSQFVELGSINKEITLALTPLDEDNAPGNPLSNVVMVKNNTHDYIVFPNDYGVRLFQYSAEGWIEIPDKMQVFIEQEHVYLQPKGEMFDQEGIYFSPDLPENTTKASIRLLVSGNLYNRSDDKVGEKVSAFIDLDVQIGP